MVPLRVRALQARTPCAVVTPSRRRHLTTPAISPAASGAGSPSFLAEVMRATPGNSRLDMCIQCGTCGGSCPSAMDMDHTPRQLFAMIRGGMRDAVFRSNVPWMCVSCYYCTVRCPQEINITDVMYTLKTLAGRERQHATPTAASFSRAFIDSVETYGRSFEVGLTARHCLRHYATRLPAMAPMMVGLLRSGRIRILPPTRIKGMEAMRKILAKAKELEAAS